MTSTSTSTKAGVVNSKLDERVKEAVVVKDKDTGTTQVNLRTVLHSTTTKKSDLAAPVAARDSSEHFDPSAGEKLVNKHDDKQRNEPAVDTSAPPATFVALKKVIVLSI